MVRTQQSQASTGMKLTSHPAWLDEDLYPFDSHYIDLDGNLVHYIDEGTGPTLLFLHAAPLWSFQYRTIIKVLRNRFRCIALDYPGFGLSVAAPDYHNTLSDNSQLVERFISELKLTDITLVGHDTGCAIGLGVVGRHPDWFKGLAISNSFAWPFEDYPKLYRPLRFIGSPAGRFLIVNFNVLIKQTGRVLAGGRLSDAELRAYHGPFIDRATRYHQYDLFRSITHSHDYLADLHERLSELSDMPVLLPWGDSDPTYKAGWLQRYEQLFPRHRSLIIAGGGHVPQEDDPLLIAKAIREWWESDVDRG